MWSALTVPPSWAMAMLGIAATALSSFACSPQVPAQPPSREQNAAKAPAVTRTVSVAHDDAETRTPLALLRRRQRGQAVTPVVALGRPLGGKNKADTQGTIQSILERELVRQALLIAARDELGLPTRDEILEESPPLPVKDEQMLSRSSSRFCSDPTSATHSSAAARAKKRRSCRNTISVPTRMGEITPSS